MCIIYVQYDIRFICIKSNDYACIGIYWYAMIIRVSCSPIFPGFHGRRTSKETPWSGAVWINVSKKNAIWKAMSVDFLKSIYSQSSGSVHVQIYDSFFFCVKTGSKISKLEGKTQASTDIHLLGGESRTSCFGTKRRGRQQFGGLAVFFIHVPILAFLWCTSAF